jgi:hypothetical protein
MRQLGIVPVTGTATCKLQVVCFFPSKQGAKHTMIGSIAVTGTVGFKLQ